LAESRFLNSLPPDLVAEITAKLVPISYHRGDYLVAAGQRIEYVYLPTDALASLVISLENGGTVEAAMVGSDGIVAVSAFLGMERADLTALIQIPGEALRLPLADFRHFLDDDSFRARVAAFTAKTVATMAQSTACMAFHPVTERLARWLLLVHDATERTELPLTHEFLAVMLGVYRPTVSVAMRTLEAAGLIEHSRGLIRIPDTDALISASCECYRRSTWDRPQNASTK
jgi:CRP-like cAMP-binding protein